MVQQRINVTASEFGPMQSNKALVHKWKRKARLGSTSGSDHIEAKKRQGVVFSSEKGEKKLKVGEDDDFEGASHDIFVLTVSTEAGLQPRREL